MIIHYKTLASIRASHWYARWCARGLVPGPWQCKLVLAEALRRVTLPLTRAEREGRS